LVKRDQMHADYLQRIMKNEIVEKITPLWGQGKAARNVARPTRVTGQFFRALLMGADECALEPIDFEAHDSSVASILWAQVCEVVAAAT